MSATEIAVCPDCQNTRLVGVFRDGIRLGSRACHCLQTRAQFRSGDGPWPIPEIIRSASLKNFLLSDVNERVREAFHGAVEYSEKPSGGILFTGSTGIGKSHLAAGILQAANVEAHFVEVPELMARLRGTFNSADERDSQIIDELARVPLLVLDDIGATRHTNYTEEKILEIVSKRYNAKKPLIVTTNKGVIEGQAAELLVDFVGDRTFDRIMGMCWRSVGRPNLFSMHGASKRWGK